MLVVSRIYLTPGTRYWSSCCSLQLYNAKILQKEEKAQSIRTVPCQGGSAKGKESYEQMRGRLHTLTLGATGKAGAEGCEVFLVGNSEEDSSQCLDCPYSVPAGLYL